jgi:predicted TIM-barrel fold metal-dependent hydrolase
MQMNDMVIASVDDHIVEPPDMFERHLTKAELVAAPRVVELEGGNQVWQWDELVAANIGLNSVVGRPKHEWGMEPTRFDQMRKASWDVDARIDDMNVNGIVGSLCFGSFIGTGGDLFVRRASKDPANALRVLQAYNDWHIDEWCGAHPGRFIPLAVLPLWDAEASVAEIRRVVGKGCRAVSFPDNPAIRGLPSIHDKCWEPLWAVCNDEEVVLNCHIGSGFTPPHPSPESPIEAWITGMPISISLSAADWITLDAFTRYPKLKMALAEGGIGWVPYLLERADFTNEHHREWTHKSYGGKKPSDVFREHVIVCFIDDRVGLKNRDAIGVDHICIEVDYPHSDCIWPKMPELVWDNMRSDASLSDEEIDKITHANVMRLYHYEPFQKLGGREVCTVGALRARAQHVDTTPVSLGGAAPLPAGERRVVTSGDVMQMLRG